MTGFGSAEVSHAGWNLRVECRSVNHRGLDSRIYIPRDWAWLEPPALAALKQRAERGRVEVRVEIEPDANAALGSVVDAARFRAASVELKALAESNGLAPPTVCDILSIRDVLSRGESQEVVEDDRFVSTIEAALDELVRNRVEEGEKLHAAMHDLVDEVEADLKRVKAILPDIANEYRQHLRNRVREALQKFDIDEISEERLMQEVVYYADKIEIAEELQRADSHVDKMRALLDLPDGSAQGKQIDFYLQELVREANTMGSKSGSPELTDAVVGIKSAIEKMREQAANIE